MTACDLFLSNSSKFTGESLSSVRHRLFHPPLPLNHLPREASLSELNAVVGARLHEMRLIASHTSQLDSALKFLELDNNWVYCNSVSVSGVWEFWWQPPCSPWLWLWPCHRCRRWALGAWGWAWGRPRGRGLCACRRPRAHPSRRLIARGTRWWIRLMRRKRFAPGWAVEGVRHGVGRSGERLSGEGQEQGQRRPSGGVLQG